MKFENCHFLKNKLKDICFSTFKFCRLDKVEKNLPEVESIALKFLVIKKINKGSIVVIIEPNKYLEGIKSVLLDSGKFMQFPIDEDKRINYIIALESDLKLFLKELKTEDKISVKELDSISLVGTMTSILCVN